MCNTGSSKIKSSQKNGVPNKNPHGEKTNLREALNLIDEVPRGGRVERRLSETSTCSETSEMAAMIEAALSKDTSGRNSSQSTEEISSTASGDFKPIRTTGDRKADRRDSKPNLTDISRKRASESPLLKSDLDLKKARIQQALSAPRLVQKTSSERNGKPSTVHPVRNGRPLPVPAEPVTRKPVPQLSLAGGRSTIHGRKTLSVREQQEKISKKNISELVIRLKAENEIEKRVRKPVERAAAESHQRRAGHAAAFGALQSVSRLPFVLDNDETPVSQITT